MPVSPSGKFNTNIIFFINHYSQPGTSIFKDAQLLVPEEFIKVNLIARYFFAIKVAELE